MTTMEIILVTLVAAICGMGSVLDERQTHRPLVACTLIGLVLGDLETPVPPSPGGMYPHGFCAGRPGHRHYRGRHP